MAAGRKAENVPSLVQLAVHEGNIANRPICAELEHNVAVVLTTQTFQPKKIACGLSTECMKRHADDGRTTDQEP